MGRMKDMAIMTEQQRIDDEYDQYNQDSEEAEKQQQEEQMWAERKWEAEREDAIELNQD